MPEEISGKPDGTANPGCTVSFEKNQTVGSSEVYTAAEVTLNQTEKSVTKGEAFGELPVPDRIGWKFAGWYTKAEGGELVTEDSVVPSGSDKITLFAHWIECSTRTVELNVNKTAGSNDLLSDSEIKLYGSGQLKLNIGDEIGPLPYPTRKGWWFDGWYDGPEDGAARISTKQIVDSTVPSVFYAHWKEREYSLNYGVYNSSGVWSDVASRKMKYGEPFDNLPSVERSGYDFVGWFWRVKDEEEREVTPMDYYLDSMGTVFVGRWLCLDYSISFYPNHTEGSNSVLSASLAAFENPGLKVQCDSQYGPLPVPVRPGWKFEGWYTAPEGGTQVTAKTIFTPSLGSSLYAHWSEVQYKLSFDSNNVSGSNDILTNATATGNPADRYLHYGDQLGELPVAERPGWEFEGWYYSITGGNAVSESTLYEPSYGSVLYAHWSEIEYPVSLDPNNVPSVYNSVLTNAQATVDRDSFIFRYGDQMEDLPVPERTGWEFDGWYTSAAGGQKLTSSLYYSQSLGNVFYAHWKEKNYSISFEDATGMAENIPDLSIMLGNEFGDSLPALTGNQQNVFSGWYTSAGEKLTSSTVYMPSLGTTFYARWEKVDPYEVIFSTSVRPGGSNSMLSGSGVSIDKYRGYYYEGESFGTLPTAERKGWIFMGWFTSSDGGEQITSADTFSLSMGQTFYTHWVEKLYTVSFNANALAGSTKLLTDSPVTGNESKRYLKYGEKYTSFPVPERIGWDFDGWYTESAGGKKVEESEIHNVDSDCTFYAHWSEKEYSVTFNINAASNQTVVFTDPNLKLKYGQSYGTLPVPVCSGWQFDGWYRDETSGVQITKDSVFSDLDKGTELYAHWTVKTVNMTVRINNCFNVYLTVDHGTDIIEYLNTNSADWLYTAYTTDSDLLYCRTAGTVSVAQTYKKTVYGNNWMKAIPDSTPLTAMTVPGSHDAGALKDGTISGIAYEYSAKDQKINIASQLNAGSRVLDIRLRVDSDYGSHLGVYHGDASILGIDLSVEMNIDFRDGVVNVIRSFLTDNPSEVVFMIVKEEVENHNSSFTGYVDAVINANKDIILTSSSFPENIGKARGKIILISRKSFGIHASSFGVPYESCYSIQDLYNVAKIGSAKKISSIKEQFNSAKTYNSGGTRWFINYCSGYKTDKFLWIDGIPDNMEAYEEVMPSVRTFVKTELDKGFYGFIMMDYMNADDAKRMYRLNPSLDVAAL